MEHVLDTYNLLEKAHNILSDEGVLVIQVPNDFSILKKHLLENDVIDNKFWVQSLDHISYFNVNGLTNICSEVGLKKRKLICDFPIDFYLLNEETNYIKDKSKGSNCHNPRIGIENLFSKISNEKTNKLYEILADMGLGRNIILFFLKTLKTVNRMSITVIVQARMGSERLLGKVIKPIIEKPMILHVLDRLKKSKYIDDIILAISTLEQELPLVNIVSDFGYIVFQGEENNVLKRYIDTINEYGGDIILRITGDCPLVDSYIVDNMITEYLMNDYNYMRLDVPNTFIRGFDVEIFSSNILKEIYGEVSKINEDSYKEHVTLYIYRNKDRFKIKEVEGDMFYNKDYRLCVDTVEDFEVVKKIYEHFKDEYVSSKDVVKFLDNNPDIAKINSGIFQKVT